VVGASKLAVVKRRKDLIYHQLMEGGGPYYTCRTTWESSGRGDAGGNSEEKVYSALTGTLLVSGGGPPAYGR